MDSIRTLKRSAPKNRIELSLSDETREFLNSLTKPPIGETSIAQKLDAIIEMEEAQNGVPANLGFVKEELSTVHGLQADVLTAINNLDRKVDEFMATQEERLRGVQEALNGIAEGINTLQQQITDLKTNNPELEDEISGLETTVQGIRDDITGVVPPAPVEGGGSEG